MCVLKYPPEESVSQMFCEVQVLILSNKKNG